MRRKKRGRREVGREAETLKNWMRRIVVEGSGSKEVFEI